MSEDDNIDWREFACDMFDELQTENFATCPYKRFSMEKGGPCQQDVEQCDSETCWLAVFERLKKRYAK